MAKSPDYTVGYGKPPTASQFRKGQSGNPRGSSKRVRARKVDGNHSPFDKITLDEITRPVAITENGVRSKITAFQAISRSLMVDAAKGSRSAQKLVLNQVQAAHERQQRAATERFGLLVQYKTEQTLARNGATLLALSDAPIWPHPDDVELEYESCIGQVVGPIDADQARPFAALVEEYRVWRARLVRLQAMEGQTGGELGTLYGHGIGAIIRLIETIRNHLPPSFAAQLDWKAGEILAGALEMEDLGGADGGTGAIIDLALLAPHSGEMAYALYVVTAQAGKISGEIRARARLNIAVNTTSLINRLRIERQNRDASAAPAPTVPDFEQFYGSLTSAEDGAIDEVAS